MAMMQSYVQEESNSALLKEITNLSNSLYKLVTICDNHKEHVNKIYEEISQKENCFDIENGSGYAYLYNLGICYIPQLVRKSIDTYVLYSNVFNLLKENFNIPDEYSEIINKHLTNCIREVNVFKENISKTPWIINPNKLDELNCYIYDNLIHIHTQLKLSKYLNK